MLLICQPAFCQSEAESPVLPESGAYQLYSALSKADALAVYDNLPSDTRNDLWKTHLLRALSETPDLTVEQQMLILAGIGIMESGILDEEVPPTSGDRADLLYHFERQAKAEFEPALGRELFANLDPSIRFGALDLAGAPCDIRGLQRLNCSCSTESDWCDFLTNPDPECIKDNFFCIPRAAGCGLFFQYSCDGICGGG
ncbi:MAG: bacteriocin fulvocin C-related protein [Acidobacteriota bacterium]